MVALPNSARRVVSYASQMFYVLYQIAATRTYAIVVELRKDAYSMSFGKLDWTKLVGSEASFKDKCLVSDGGQLFSRFPRLGPRIAALYGRSGTFARVVTPWFPALCSPLSWTTLV